MKPLTRPTGRLLRDFRRKYGPLGETIDGTLWIPRPVAVQFIEDCRDRNLFIAAMSVATMHGGVLKRGPTYQIPISEWAARSDGATRVASALLRDLDSTTGVAIWAAFEFLSPRG